MNHWNRIKTKLEAEGILTNGIGRRVQARSCTRCHAKVLAGADGDVCGRVCYVDPTPLDRVGEALAVLTGRYVVALWRDRDRYELEPRDQFGIKHSPAGTPGKRYDVLAEHVCGAPPLPSAPSVHVAPPVAHTGDEPPF